MSKSISFTVKIDSHLSEKLTKVKTTMNADTNKEMLEKLIDLVPLYELMRDSGLTVNQALERIRYDSVKTQVKIIRKGVNEHEFEKWQEKLFQHNDNAKPDEKVFLTQRIFISLIGGNVQSISKLFKEHEVEITEHNKKHGLDDTTNRTLSYKLRHQYGTITVVDWLKSFN